MICTRAHIGFNGHFFPVSNRALLRLPTPVFTGLAFLCCLPVTPLGGRGTVGGVTNITLSSVGDKAVLRGLQYMYIHKQMIMF